MTEQQKEARTCSVCGQSEDKVSPAGDCPATDKVGIHNFTAEGGDDPTRQKRPPAAPPSEGELQQILEQQKTQTPDRPLGS